MIHKDEPYLSGWIIFESNTYIHSRPFQHVLGCRSKVAFEQAILDVNVAPHLSPLGRIVAGFFALGLGLDERL